MVHHEEIVYASAHVKVQNITKLEEEDLKSLPRPGKNYSLFEEET